MKTARCNWLSVLIAVAAIRAASAANVLVPFNATWRYLADGSNPGASWHTNSFNDAAWPAGAAQLGFGDQDETTVIPGVNIPIYTFYFRTSFTVDDPAQLPQLRLRAIRDDGMIVYINGREVWRDNMPAGAVTGATRALVNLSSPEENATIQKTISPQGVLQQGTNVVAVEIHQSFNPTTDLSFSLEASSDNPLVVRGPYLQMGSPTGMVVRWRTSTNLDSWVAFGPDPQHLFTTTRVATVTSEHVVPLQGLAPQTRYFYRIGYSGGSLAGGDMNHWFRTSPPVGAPVATRIWVLGDSGTKDQNARNVRDAFYGWHGTATPDLWLMLGDNAYSSGTDAEHQLAVFDMYPQTLRTSSLWPTFGNHEGYSGARSDLGTGPYYDIFSLPRAGECGGVASGTEAYYSFDRGNIHFICLNSFDIDRSTNGTMAAWLRSDLAASDADWTIAFWHHPPYSKGSHNSDAESELVQMRTNLLPILEAGGVDLVLCGHSHSYERSFLLHGHYGVSTTLQPSMIVDGGDGRSRGDGPYNIAATNGTVYAVAGSSGLVSYGPLNHPVMVMSLMEHGSMALDIASNRLDAVFIDDAGAVRDSFSMLRAGGRLRVTTSASGPGIVAPASQWVLPGSPLEFSAAGSNYHALAHWTNSLVGSVNPTTVLARADMDVTGVFEALLATEGVPLWWLAEYGLETNDTGAVADPDKDGMPAWAEYVAGTGPTNGASRLEISAFAPGGATGEVSLAWTSESNRLYRICTGDAPGSVVSCVASNIPATPPVNVYTNRADSERGFLRIQVERTP